MVKYRAGCPSMERSGTNLLLSVGPARNLDDHVEDGLLLIGVERNVVEGRDWDAILLDVGPPLEGVEGADVADGVSHLAAGRRRRRS